MIKTTLTFRYYLLMISFGAIFFTSCKKEDSPSPEKTLSLKNKLSVIPPFIFDWEKTTYMPSNPANVIPMPWIGSVGGIDANIVGDYKKADGWELVYDTFDSNTSPSQIKPGGLYFALYNKYRGLLRFYLYIPPGTITASSQILHGLSLFGNSNSQMLNFESGGITNAGEAISGFAKTNNQQINLMGNWIAMDYEIAYDPNISNTTFPSFGIQWNTKTVNITNFNLNGTQTGSINGTITSPTSGDITSILNVATKAGLTFAGASGVQALLGKASTEAEKGFYNSISGAITNLLSGKMSGFFSALVGGSSSNTQQVRLNMDTKIELQGTATNSSGLSNSFLVLPGQSNSQVADGLIPQYNQTMGIVNLLNAPEILAQNYHVFSTFRGPHSAKWKFKFNDNNLPKNNLVFNPEILRIADIENIKEDLLVLNPTLGAFTGAEAAIFTVTGGTFETVGNDKVYVNPVEFPGKDRSYQYYRDFSYPDKKTADPRNWQLAVRISFDVIPKDGSKKVTIVKTFNLKKTDVSMPSLDF
ncbi:hypothetical protein IM793_15415 [Pedobacter sp. MR2016-19]|uniref:hypothetical protein n=1 Tax=Pedobacter sp. MR2016-19 TaxID=2780089 RepID=UPI00187649AA|nr:hypothetical protein [Pedobacter sp. MR2016-19]MBE5320555.1 hypothetical protein [Pedobacter sp. MR2016-19]